MKSKVTSTRARIKLRRILQNSPNEIKDAMQDSANILEKEMRSRAPRDTGNMVDHISSFVSKNGMRAEAGFRGKRDKKAAWYARFVEFGTKSHQIKPATKEVLAGDGVVFGASAEHPGTPARPFIQPSWDAKKPEVVARVGKAIQKSIEIAQK